MAVFLVVGGINLVGRRLRAALRRHALRGRLLLRHHRLQLQLAELHVGTHAEEARGTLDERVARRERHVAGLHQLDNLVLLALVAQLQVLRVEVEGGVRVVVQVHVHLVAHLAVDVQIHLLIEVEGRRLAVADGQRGVVDVLHRGAHLQLGRSLRLDAHAAWSEDFLCRSQVEVHVCERELVLVLRLVGLVVLLAEEELTLSALRPQHILLGRHQDRRVQVGIAQLRADEVESQRVHVLRLLTDIVGHAKVDGGRVEVAHLHRCRPLDAPAGMQQRVGNRLVLDLHLRLRLRHRLLLLCLVILRR